MEKQNKLTVLIPTYDRFEGIVSTLRKLDGQTVKEFEVFILDNGSPYRIDEVFEGVSPEFRDRCTFYQRPVNVGINANITEILGYCKTQWAWTLSDDDVIFEDSVEKILFWINENQKAGCLHFTILDSVPIDRNGCIRLNTINEFVDYYEQLDSSNSLRHGDLIFLSNKVININFCRRYFYEMCMFSYNYLALFVIFFMALIDGASFVVINEKICRHGTDGKITKKPGWNFYQAYLGVRTFFDVPMKVDTKTYNRMMKMILFDIRDLFYACFVASKDGEFPITKKDYFEQLYYGGYRKILPFKQKVMLYTISKFMKHGHIKICRMIMKMVYKK